YFGIAFVRLLVYSFDFSVPFYLYCNKIAPTDTYALSLHDALPISPVRAQAARARSGSGTSDQGEPGPGGARQRGRGAAGGDPCARCDAGREHHRQVPRQARGGLRRSAPCRDSESQQGRDLGGCDDHPRGGDQVPDPRGRARRPDHRHRRRPEVTTKTTEQETAQEAPQSVQDATEAAQEAPDAPEPAEAQDDAQE